jgi:hypothetical protein
MGILWTFCCVCGGRLNITHASGQVIGHAKHATRADCRKALAEDVTIDYDLTIPAAKGGVTLADLRYVHTPVN